MPFRSHRLTGPVTLFAGDLGEYHDLVGGEIGEHRAG
jgi:hypothetical protein